MPMNEKKKKKTPMEKNIPCGQKAALAPYNVDIFYFTDKINCVTGSVKILLRALK